MKRTAIPRAVVLLLLAGASARAGAQDLAPEFTKAEFARERVGHKVVADLTLSNPLSVELRDVRMTAIFFDSERELRRAAPVSIDRIPPGGAEKAHVEAVNLPNFTRYEVIVESGAQRWVYMGDDPDRPPVISRAGAARLSVLWAKDQKPGSFPGAGLVTIAVRNLGESPARVPTAILTYRAKGGAIVRRLHVRLPETIAGDTVDTFELRIPALAEYSLLDVGAACVAQEISSPADSQFEGDTVAVRQVRIGRLSNGTVVVSGQIRNGLRKGVEKVTVTFQLGKKEIPLGTPAPLASGGVWPFDLYVLDCPPVDGCTYGLDYTESAGGAPAAPAEDRGPAAKRLASRKGSEVDPAVAQQAKMTVEVRGIKWIEGSQFLAMKGGGDIAYLRLAIRDRLSKPVHPGGRATVVVSDGARSLGTAARPIRDESWGMDTEELAGLKVPVEGLAYDPTQGELFIGVARGDRSRMALRLDVTLTLDGGGVWEWKGLEKAFEVPPKGPDRPEVRK
jgi:hypothetical protein